jgi:restriction endonuclease S subunit
MFNYVYYLLKHNEECIKEKYVVKTGAPSINLNEFINEFEIPIPSIEIQKIIADKLDILTENNKTNYKSIEELKSIMKIYVDMKTFRTEKKKFKENCTFVNKVKKLKASDGFPKGKYRFYSSGNKILYRDDYEFENDYIMIGRGGQPTIHFDSHFSVSHDDVYVIDKIRDSNNKYIYYYLLHHNDILENGFNGAIIKHISKEYLNDIDIPIPSKEIQNEIIKYCDTIQKDIDIINNRINENNTLINYIINFYLGT